jgi:hypothetical protein
MSSGFRTLRAALVVALLACTPAAWCVEAYDDVQISAAAAASCKRGLAHLASTQREDGSWPGRFGGTVGIVSSCAISFMGAGHVPDRGEYGKQCARSIQFIVRCAQPNGLLYRKGMEGEPMYHHGLGTLALAEAWGMTQDKKIQEALKRAVELIVSTQNKQGGWRYQPQIKDADLSVTVMQLMALRAAKDAGIFVPKEVIDLGISYVKACHNSKESGKDGGFAYEPGQPSLFAQTGAGVLALQVAGNYRAGEVIHGVEYLLKFQPLGSEVVKAFYSYGHYYAAMGIYQVQSIGEWGRRAWNSWYPAITKDLLAKQKADGSWRASYDQYDTAMALLVLEIPYRYLPIYQR